MQRRHFLKHLSVLGAMSSFSLSHAKPPSPHHIIAASDDAKAQHGITWGSADTPQHVTLPWRGHGLAMHPLKPGRVLLFARRPGTECYEVDLASQRISHTYSAQAEHNFCGHGCFSQDGRRLFTTEMDNTTGTGKIGVRDSLTYRLLNSYDSGGIDPHEIHCLSDGKTLVVANGGILTHPSSGRKKLNLDTMQSNLVFLYADNGEIQRRLTTPWQQASIRHFTVSKQDQIAIAMQYQRAAVTHQDLIPLAGFLTPQQKDIQFAHQPDTLIAQMNDYAGSVVLHEALNLAAFSSPRGNIVAFWHTDGRYAGHHRMQDVCGLGISPDQAHFILSNSQGELRYIRTADLQEDRSLRQHFQNTRWDNHMLTDAKA